jgi:hypothetical protein
LKNITNATEDVELRVLRRSSISVIWTLVVIECRMREDVEDGICRKCRIRPEIGRQVASIGMHRTLSMMVR